MQANSHSDLGDLKNAVRILWSTFGRKADEQTQTVWARSLHPYDGPVLKAALRYAAESPKMLSLGELLERIRARTSTPQKAHRDLTDAERMRADAACVMAGLWLHYECGWPLARIAGEVVGRQLGMDPVRALEEAKRQLPRDRVFGWMSSEARKDPIPGDAEHARHGRIST